MRAVLWFIVTLTFVLHIFVKFVTAEIRCYCNLPSCVSTGYMCKSSAGACFSELPPSNVGYYAGQKSHRAAGHRRTHHHNSHRNRHITAIDFTQTRHGCVESLKSHLKSEKCKSSTYIPNETNPDKSLKASGEWTIACCHKDMCNYIDSLDIKIQISTKNNNNHSTGANDIYNKNSRNPSENYNRSNAQQDLWFKAAVIAVPIAGGFILIFLIFLAIRMLRKDASHQKQILPVHHRYFSSKMSCNTHNCDKNDLNSKANKAFSQQNQSNLFKNDMEGQTAASSNLRYNAESDKLLLGSAVSWPYFVSQKDCSSI